MNRPFRCLVCRPEETPWGLEFESHEPVCPRCHAGPPGVIPLVRVHFLYQDAAGPIVGQVGHRWTLACRPKAANFGRFGPAHTPASNEPRAVTCPECMKTKQYQHAKEVVDAIGAGVLIGAPEEEREATAQAA